MMQSMVGTFNRTRPQQASYAMLPQQATPGFDITTIMEMMMPMMMVMMMGMVGRSMGEEPAKIPAKTEKIEVKK